MHKLRSLAFPTLHESQVEELGRCAGASAQPYQDAQTLFRVGERDFKLGFADRCNDLCGRDRGAYASRVCLSGVLAGPLLHEAADIAAVVFAMMAGASSCASFICV